MTDESVWDTQNGGVRVVLPSGQVITENELSAQKLKDIVSGEGIRKFIVKDQDDECISPGDLPVSSGEIRIEEYNEAK